MIRAGDTVYYFPPMVTRARYALPAVVRAKVGDVYDFGNRATLKFQGLTFPMLDLRADNVRVLHSRMPGRVPEGCCMERWPSRLEFHEWLRRETANRKTFMRRKHWMADPKLREAMLAWKAEEAMRA